MTALAQNGKANDQGVVDVMHKILEAFLKLGQEPLAWVVVFAAVYYVFRQGVKKTNWLLILNSAALLVVLLFDDGLVDVKLFSEYDWNAAAKEYRHCPITPSWAGRTMWDFRKWVEALFVLYPLISASMIPTVDRVGYLYAFLNAVDVLRMVIQAQRWQTAVPFVYVILLLTIAAVHYQGGLWSQDSSDRPAARPEQQSIIGQAVGVLCVDGAMSVRAAALSFFLVRSVYVAIRGTDSVGEMSLLRPQALTALTWAPACLYALIAAAGMGVGWLRKDPVFPAMLAWLFAWLAAAPARADPVSSEQADKMPASLAILSVVAAVGTGAVATVVAAMRCMSAYSGRSDACDQLISLVPCAVPDQAH